MINFEDAWEALVGNEGGYSNDPNDPGGETMWGVTARVARAWGYTGDMKLLPLATAQEIAKKEYWNKYQCDAFDIHVGFQVLDAAYNGGHPAQWLQKSAGVIQDGVIGTKTIKAVNTLDPRVVCLRFDAYRLQYLTELGTWPNFGKGWARRIAANMLRAAE